MNKKLSNEWFNNHVEAMLNDYYLKNRGISSVLRTEDFVIISIPIINKGLASLLKIENINFDINPPNVYFVDPINYNKLPENLYPRGSGIAGGHDILPNPIICIVGTYAYHTHPSHRNTPFDIYRNKFLLQDLITHIVRNIDTKWIIPKGGCSNVL